MTDRQRHFVQTVDGQQVEIIIRDDLDEIKDILLGRLASLTRWLIGVGLVAAFSLGFYVRDLQSQLNSHSTAIADLVVNGSKPVQDLKTDLAATRERITALQQQMERLENLMDRRSQ